MQGNHFVWSVPCGCGASYLDSFYFVLFLFPLNCPIFVKFYNVSMRKCAIEKCHHASTRGQKPISIRSTTTEPYMSRSMTPGGGGVSVQTARHELWASADVSSVCESRCGRPKHKPGASNVRLRATPGPQQSNPPPMKYKNTLKIRTVTSVQGPHSDKDELKWTQTRKRRTQ